MLHAVFKITLLATIFTANTGVSSTIRIATYNILDFPDSYGLQRVDDLRVVMEYINPDILVVQEMQNQLGVEMFLDSVMIPLHNAFTSLPFHNGPDTDNSFFYRQDKIDYLGANYISTPNRDIGEYRLLLRDSQRELRVFSVHFKASQGASNEAIRLQEATILRNYTNTFLPGTDFVVMGDFNIYYSDESSFQMLVDSLANNNGRLFDPLNVIGSWHENSDYSAVHSQSTRVEQLPDGGAGGGLDDRFDMILCSRSLLDSAGLLLLQDSHTICGNDGAHFNVAVNYGYNSAVPVHVADALYWASDHLPLFVDLSIDTIPVVEEVVVKVWPNPMKDWAHVTFPWYDDFTKARIVMTNILGQRVYDQETSDPLGYRIERDNLPLGVYFLTIVIHTRYNKFQYQSRLAIVK